MKICVYASIADKNNPYQVNTRNNVWWKKLAPNLHTHRCFIAVGAGHLLNDRKTGIIDLLRELGYVVTPVNLEK